MNRAGSIAAVLAFLAILGWLRLVHVSVSNEMPSVVQIAFEETRDVHRDETVRQTKTPSHTLTRLPPWCTHPRGQVVGDLLQSPECDYHVYSPEQMQDAFANQHIVFYGVSYTRNMYRCFCDLLTNGGSRLMDARWPRSPGSPPSGLTVACNNQNANGHFNNRIEIPERNISVEYYWSSLKTSVSKECTEAQCMVTRYASEAHFPQELVANASGCAPDTPACPTSFLIRYSGYRQRDIFIPQLLEFKRRHNYPVTMFMIDARGDGSHPELERINLPRFVYAFENKSTSTNWDSPYLQEFTYTGLQQAFDQECHLHGNAALSFVHITITLLDRLLQHTRDPTKPFSTPAPTVSSLIARNLTHCLDIYPHANDTFCSTERFHESATGAAYDWGALNHFKTHLKTGFP